MMKKGTKRERPYTFTKQVRDKLKKGLSKEQRKEIDDIWEKYVGKPRRMIRKLYEQ
mgnify:CR=1 FL=1|jgi:hypothetical protein|tara:strand:- start:581 stop:748 length:168 start_codon:yes stop_codon:yes gene_type:complete